MQITKSEIKEMTGVITMVVEPADYQEEVQKEPGFPSWNGACRIGEENVW